MWSEDLQRAGVLNEEAAMAHYLRHGHAEGRLYQQHRIILSYCTGQGEVGPRANCHPCTRAEATSHRLKRRGGTLHATSLILTSAHHSCGGDVDM